MYRSNNNNDNDSDDDDIIFSNPILTQPELTLDDGNNNNNVTPPPLSSNLAYGSAALNQLRDENPSKNDSTNNNLEKIVSNMDSLLLSIGETPLNTTSTEDILNSLTEEQQNAVNLILSDRKKNVFIKGNPGTGKSFLLLQLKKILQNQKKKFQYLAPMGNAAENIGGTTIHSFFKFTNVKEPYNFIDNPNHYKHRVERPDIIVIDEISQVSGMFLDLIDNKAKFLWNNDESMGGCQVIICGDFFQLPPIKFKEESKKRGCPRNETDEGYAFQSKVWSKLNLQTVELTVPKRQSNPQFYNILNQVRVGNIKEEHIGYLRSMTTVKSCKKLFSTNKLVDSHNAKEYENRKSNSKSSEHKYYTSTIKGQNISISKKENIKLIVGIEVMLTANLKLHCEPYLINGSRGIVRGFESYDKVIEKLFEDKKNIAENESYDSGTRNKLIDYIICLIEVIGMNGREQKTLEYPIVEFGKTRVTVLPFRTYENESSLTYESESLYQQVAVPLAYSYALTIHKSQGLSFDSLTVDLSGLKKDKIANAYVALSRCKDPTKLTIENIDKLLTLGKPNSSVTDFYSTGDAIVWNENVDDLFILCDEKDFICPDCGKKSKACFDAENPPVAFFLRDRLPEKPDEESMSKIVLALSKQGFFRINQLKRSRKGLEEDVLRNLFRSEEIPIRVAEDTISAIQSLFNEDQQNTRSRR